MSGGLIPVAAVITEWRKNSHADVILARLLEPEAWGHSRAFRLRLASVYADQFPENDLCRTLCAKHGVPIFPTIIGAVGVGTRGVPVDGVLLIGEHGDYATNPKGQKLYPRRRLFEEVVHAFRMLGRRVPVFVDKHLSYDWLFARWMVDLARHEGFPLMAGSSVPVAWRSPALELPLGAAVQEALGLGYSDRDAYGFHALEGLQCLVERRAGGETGVASVRCVSGGEVWARLSDGTGARALLDAIGTARRDSSARGPAPHPLPDDTLFLIEYADGLKATVAMLDSVGECFGCAALRRDADHPDAMIFDIQNVHPFGHFGHLVRAVEHMMATGRPAYPVERTLLTTGMLSALLQSRADGGTTIPTPHLRAVRYEAASWPYATGKSGTPA